MLPLYLFFIINMSESESVKNCLFHSFGLFLQQKIQETSCIREGVRGMLEELNTMTNDGKLFAEKV